MTMDTDWQSMRRAIEALYDDVVAEIRNYPPPIPACDAHFNHLLDLRRLLPKELDRLDAAAADDALTVDAFIRQSPCAEALSKRVPAE